MDPNFEKRLLDVQNGQNINYSPINKSPLKDVTGDRFIPVRSKAIWRINFDNPELNTDASTASPPANSSNSASTSISVSTNTNTHMVKSPAEQLQSKQSIAYSCLLKNELLGAQIDDIRDEGTDGGPRYALAQKDTKNLFRYRMTSTSPSSTESSPYSLSPVGHKSQQLLCSPRKSMRKISKIPYKVLDAPELQDDFYLNLVDWSLQNILSVGLGSCVYLWNAYTSQVTRLCDLSSESDSVTSVSWGDKSGIIAVGTHKGFTQIWDTVACKRVSVLTGHTGRVGALAWNGELLASGSRDRTIKLRDARLPSSELNDKKLTEHRQEVCGLEWSPDRQYLASGGNDNKLLIWSLRATNPVQTYTEHVAAVKAIAWSPHQHGLLASGGGTADRKIRFWNTLTGRPIQAIDAGSQVCNLAWSKHSNELVSTHGYSQNQILVWKYPALVQIAKLTGHTFRVLYLATSPDGESIVTGAGDETLRFWNVFSKSQSRKEISSVLNLFTRIR